MKRTWEFEIDVPAVGDNEEASKIANRMADALRGDDDGSADVAMDADAIFNRGSATFIGVIDTDSEDITEAMHARVRNSMKREVTSRWRDITVRPWDFEYAPPTSPSFTKGHWTVDWEDVDEQASQDDPEDTIQLWRATLEYDGQSCAKGSYCTRAPLWVLTADLEKYSIALMDKLPAELPPENFDGNEWNFPHDVMERWTWETEGTEES
jgi:hypothetical protein